jgi:uncharacterized protein (DUF1499 family)
VVLSVSAENKMDIRLPPCPESPNCVCSQTEPESDHFIEPFDIKGSSNKAWEALKKILKKQKRTSITKESEGSIDAEVKSMMFRFVDDIQFRLDIQAGVIHIRSASRTGYSDLGVNRKRVEEIRKQLRVMGAIE